MSRERTPEERAAELAAQRAAAIALCPLRAAVRCPCGRNAVQDAADALAELDAPCPDCGRDEGRVLDRGRASPAKPTQTPKNTTSNPTNGATT